jgi:hypothetical protein
MPAGRGNSALTDYKNQSFILPTATQWEVALIFLWGQLAQFERYAHI